MKFLIKNIFILFVLLSVLSSCKKDEDNPAPNADFYFTGTIDGQAISFLVPQTPTSINDYGSGPALGSSSDGVTFVYQQGFNITNIESQPEIQVGLIEVFNVEATIDNFLNMFSIKSYNYGKFAGTSDSVDGAFVSYTDSNGTFWTSYNGSGEQTSSTFEVTEYIDNSDAASNIFTGKKIATFRFNCTLYDNAGNSIQVQDGVLRGIGVVE